MKKKLFSIAALFLLVGCTNDEQNLAKTIYSDKATATDGNISLSFEKLDERKPFGSDAYSVSFTLKLLSSNLKPVEYKIVSPKFIREANGAEYSVNMLFGNSISLNLECDVAKTYSFSATFPTSIADDNYYFTFEGNSVIYKYCLYETPDELRTKFSVKLVIDGSEVKTIQFPERRKLSAFDWISPDYIYGCNEWYLDSSLKNQISDRFLLTQNITIYGKKKTILKYDTPDETNSAFIAGYNFVPSNGEIVVPKYYAGKSIYCILAGSFWRAVGGMKKIYIPKISSISYFQNFSECKDLETVFFEGTESEWKSINEATFKNSVTFVFNTYK